MTSRADVRLIEARFENNGDDKDQYLMALVEADEHSLQLHKPEHKKSRPEGGLGLSRRLVMEASPAVYGFMHHHFEAVSLDLRH